MNRKLCLCLTNLNFLLIVHLLGPAPDPTESMRRKTYQCIEYGPNATWIPFPKTKLMYMAAKTNNLDMAREVVGDANINAHGTCKLWTPLHVAAFEGSLGKDIYIYFFLLIPLLHLNRPTLVKCYFLNTMRIKPFRKMSIPDSFHELLNLRLKKCWLKKISYL